MGEGGNIWVTILPLIILIAVMYFLLIRPQKKREKEVNAMRSSVQVGVEIITIGGICGRVVKTKEESLVIQVGSDRVKFEIMRWAVSKIVEESTRHAAAVEDDDTEEVEVKKSKPKRIKRAPAAEEEKPAEEQEAEEPAEEPAAEENEAAPEADAAEETAAEEKEEK